MYLEFIKTNVSFRHTKIVLEKEAGHMSNQPHPGEICPWKLHVSSSHPSNLAISSLRSLHTQHSFFPTQSSSQTKSLSPPNMATSTFTTTTTFLGTRLPGPKSPGSGKFKALFNFVKKAAPAKKAAPPPRPKPVSDDRPVWFPGAQAPEWLDGSMVGDRGFDPFGLGKPAEYLQYDYDGLDQNLAKNIPGDIIGTRFEETQVNPTPFQPYTEVFGIQRFRECEVIHGRWAMLATLGALSVEALTGVAWQDAGKVELIEGSSYLGLKLPFSLTALIWIEVLLVGYIEFQRNAELDPEKRIYPGGKFFDPLGLAEDPDKKLQLQLAEIKHSRLAMVAFLGFAIQAAATGQGPLSNAAAFLSDPSNNILKTFSS